MIGDGLKYYYLAITNLSGLHQGNSSNHRGDFYCLNCLIHILQKINLKDMKKYVIITIVGI